MIPAQFWPGEYRTLEEYQHGLAALEKRLAEKEKENRERLEEILSRWGEVEDEIPF